MKTILIGIAVFAVCLGGGYFLAPRLMSKPAPAPAAEASPAPSDTAQAAVPPDSTQGAAPAGAAPVAGGGENSRERLIQAAAAVRASEQELVALESQISTLQGRMVERRMQRTRAVSLAQTIGRLGAAERKQLVERLDAQTLGYLLVAASEETRGKLLEGLPPAEAAELIRLLVVPPSPVGSGADPRP